jgi:hypothetical protein
MAFKCGVGVCIVCGAVSKYRCPKCRELYCSLACCSTHKTRGDCEKAASADKMTATSSSGGSSGSSSGLEGRSCEGGISIEESRKTEAETIIQVADRRPVDSKGYSRIKDNVGEVLSTRQKEAISQSKEAVTLLRSKRLQEELLRIHRGPDRQMMLKKARTIPEFESFVDILLKTAETANSGTK